MGRPMKRVIIADDHPVFRAGVLKSLTATGRIDVVAEASDGVELLALSEEHQPDIIVTDVAMPHKDGVAVAREVSAWAHAPKVVVLTAHVSVFVALRCYRAGAHGFIGKTSPTTDLLAAVETVARGRRYVPPEMLSDVASYLLEHRGEGDPMESVTARELEVMRLIAAGSSNREIGADLGISVRTVDTHRSNLLKKLGLRNNADLTRVAVAFGIVPA